jgi:hypothetical protein
LDNAGWTKKHVVTRIYMMDDNTSQQMNAMIQTSQDDCLKTSFRPLILVALSIVAEKIETSF